MAMRSAGGENSQGTLRSVRNPLDMRLHAAADVEQQEDIYGHAFAGKVSDGLGLAIHPEHEIIRLQTGYRPALEVDNLGIDARHRHIALENCGVIRRQRSHDHRKEESGNTFHTRNPKSATREQVSGFRGELRCSPRCQSRVDLAD